MPDPFGCRHGKCTEQAERCSGFFFCSSNLWSENNFFLSPTAKILSSILYQAVRGKIILGWVTFPGYVTLSSAVISE